MSDVCRYCGCKPSQARADAKTLGLQEEFQRGLYTCCQVVAWADEQWLAWVEAAEADGSPVEQATQPLEYADPELVFVPVRRCPRPEPPEGSPRPFGPSGGDPAA
jgi:hypothetical protein